LTESGRATEACLDNQPEEDNNRRANILVQRLIAKRYFELEIVGGIEPLCSNASNIAIRGSDLLIQHSNLEISSGINIYEHILILPGLIQIISSIIIQILDYILLTWSVFSSNQRETWVC
jgi:hypothetical protein